MGLDATDRRKLHPFVRSMLGLAVLTVAGCTRFADPRVDTVVLISIDSLRADHVGAYGYGPPTTPTIDRLGAGGLVFERAYATSSWTLPSHAALLSGRFDDAHGAFDDGRTIAPGVPMLAEVLRAAGVRTTGFYSGPYLDPSFGFGRGFDEYIGATSYSSAGAGAPVPNEASHQDITNPILKSKINHWLETTHLGARNFIFIHMWDVHFDYIAPERYVSLFDPDYSGTVDGRNYQANETLRPDMPARDLQHLLALYDAEIRWTDDTLAELLEMFRRKRLLENAAVIVAADHGDEFFEHGHKGHRWTLFEEVIRVPLVVSLTGRTASLKRVDRVVSLVDVFPTVCELLGVDFAYDGPGFSLLPMYFGRMPQDRRHGTMAELTTALYHRDLDAIVRPADKLIRWNGNGALRYYGMTESRPERGGVDPAKLPTPLPDVTSAVAMLDEWIERAAAEGRRMGVGTVAPAAPAERVREQLRALGYIR